MSIRPKTGGRKAGTPNKITADLKAMILGALEDAGGREYLAAQAKTSPAAFMALLGKVLPMQVTGNGGGSIEVATTVSYSSERRSFISDMLARHAAAVIPPQDAQ